MSFGECDSQVAQKAMNKLYKHEHTADIYFVFKSGERIPAHKYLLAAASELFDAMFYGPIKKEGDVEMDKVSAGGFVEFLQFFYSNTIKLTMTNIGDVMSYGHKYEVAESVNLCVWFLMENLTADNVLQAHGLAILFKHNDLRAKCKHLTSYYTEDVLQSASFLECDRTTLNYILALDVLSCPKTIVFGALMSWVKAASGKEELTKGIVQTHLSDLFYKIRFRSMGYDEFVSLLPAFGQLFTADEFNEILQMIGNENFQPKIFNTLHRTPTTHIITYPPSGVGAISINVPDFKCLAVGEHLNDVIINFYLQYIFLEVLTAEQKKKTHIFDTFFYESLTSKRIPDQHDTNVLKNGLSV